MRIGKAEENVPSPSFFLITLPFLSFIKVKGQRYNRRDYN